MHALSIDLRLLGQQPFGELLLRHLEAEDRNRLLSLERRVQGDVESQRSVVDEDVLSDEVVGLWNRQVINLVLASWLNRHNFVPINVLTRKLRQRPVPKHVGIDRKTSLRNAARSVWVEATLASAWLARASGDSSQGQAPHLSSHPDFSPNFLRQDSKIPAAIIRVRGESAAFLANPANRSLVNVN